MLRGQLCHEAGTSIGYVYHEHDAVSVIYMYIYVYIYSHIYMYLYMYIYRYIYAASAEGLQPAACGRSLRPRPAVAAVAAAVTRQGQQIWY